MENICPICKSSYDGVTCTKCTVTNLDFGELGPTESLKVENQENNRTSSNAYLVDLVSNRKIPVTTPYCKVGRDNLNDIVISGDPSISRFHFILAKENDQYFAQDSNSRHGTFLNGNQITNSEPIHDGDVIKIGVSLFWFVIEIPSDLSTDNGPQAVQPVDIAMQGDTPATAVQTEAQAVAQSDLPPLNTAATKESDSSDANDVEITGAPLKESLRKPSIEQASSKKEETKKRRESSKIKQQTSATTLEKLFETVNERVKHSKSDFKEISIMPESKDISVGDFQPSLATTNESKSHEHKPGIEEFSSKGAESAVQEETNAMSMVKEADTPTIPDWTRKFFSAELIQLSQELTESKEQARLAQQKMKDVEERIKTMEELRSTLLTAHGSKLVDACCRVLSMLGFNIKPASDNQQELYLKDDDNHSCLARIVSPETQADRSDLGQLSILQTRYWCEEGLEPKGILIISQTRNEPAIPLTSENYDSELANYAAKKNVCLITTLQMLVLYRELILSNREPVSLRKTIMSTAGWLVGFDLKPSHAE